MLWEGDIRKKDGSIQLLLIVDYICDWARSVHREAIIRELYELAQLSSDAPSDNLSIDRLTIDSYRGRRNDFGIFQDQGGSQIRCEAEAKSAGELQKLFNRVDSWSEHIVYSDLNSKLEDNPLYRYDSLHGVIRDVMHIRCRMICLYITKATLNELSRCRPSENQSTYFLKRLKNRLKEEEPVLIEQSTLYDIEEKWTGNRRDHRVPHNPLAFFQVLFTISAYVESDWSLTRELCVVAISESAKELLHEKVRKSAEEVRQGYMRKREELRLSTWGANTVSKIFKPYVECPARQMLLACLYRTSLQPIRTSRLKDLDQYDIIHKWKKSGKIICAMDSSAGTRSRDLVRFIYRGHRVGNNDVSMSYLWVSQKSNNKLSSRVKPFQMNPWGTYRLGASEKAVLVYSEPLDHSAVVPEQARYCIYILNMSQVSNLVREIGTRSIHFTGCNITQRISPTTKSQHIFWNSSNRVERGEKLKNASKLVNYLKETLLNDDDDADDDTDGDANGEADGDADSDYELGTDTGSSDSDIGSDEDASEEGSELEGSNVTESDEYFEEDDSYSENERTSDSD
jgi:hypothetical protein